MPISFYKSITYGSISAFLASYYSAVVSLGLNTQDAGRTVGQASAQALVKHLLALKAEEKTNRG